MNLARVLIDALGMENSPNSSAKGEKPSVGHRRTENIHPRTLPPRCGRMMHSPHSVPSFISYNGIYQAPELSAAPSAYRFPTVNSLPLQRTYVYGGTTYVVMQTWGHMLPHGVMQYVPVPVQAVSINGNCRASCHNLDSRRSSSPRGAVRSSETYQSSRCSVFSFEQPLATSSQRSSFSQTSNGQRRPSSSNKTFIGKHVPPLNSRTHVSPTPRPPMTFPFRPASSFTSEQRPASILTYSFSPAMNPCSFSPTYCAGTSSQPPPPRQLTRPVPSAIVMTFPQPLSAAEYKQSSNSVNRQDATLLPHLLPSFDSGFQSAGSGLDATHRSLTYASPVPKKNSNLMGKYYISNKQITFDPPLDLSSNEVNYMGPLTSTRNETSYSYSDQSSLQLNSIQKQSNGTSEFLDSSSITGLTKPEQEWIEAKPVKVSDRSNVQLSSTQEQSSETPQSLDLLGISDIMEPEQEWFEAIPVEVPEFFNMYGPPETHRNWEPTIDFSLDEVNYTGPLTSTRNEASSNQWNLQMSSIQESSDGLPESFALSDVSVTTKADQEWIPATPVEVPKFDVCRTLQTPRKCTPPRSSDSFDLLTPPQNASVQTPREWIEENAHASVQTPWVIGKTHYQ